MGRVITFAQQKGGAGKTTLLAHMARAAQTAGASIALVDLDPQATLSNWCAIDPEKAPPLLETASYRIGPDLRAARDAYDLVLVDCPGSADPILEAALRASDLVLLPCQPTPLDVWAIKPVHEMAAKEGVTAMAVLNRVPPRGRAAQSCASQLEHAGIRLISAQIGNRTAFANAMGRGLAVQDLPGQARAKEEAAAFYESVMELLAQDE